MLPLPLLFSQERGEGAPCGRSDCFPLMWKTNGEKEGRQRGAGGRAARPPYPASPNAGRDPDGAGIATAQHGPQGSDAEFRAQEMYSSFGFFSLVFCRGTKRFKGGTSASLAIHHANVNGAGKAKLPRGSPQGMSSRLRAIQEPQCGQDFMLCQDFFHLGIKE